MGPYRFAAVLLLLALAASACAPALSPELRRRAVDVRFARLAADPRPYEGQVVILHGQVSSLSQTPEGTLAALRHIPDPRADFGPSERGVSGGVFHVLIKGDAPPPALGDEVQVAGRVLRVKPPEGERSPGLLLEALEIRPETFPGFGIGLGVNIGG